MQPNPWFFSIPATLTVIALAMLVRDSGVLTWSRKIFLGIRANQMARREYPRFVKLVERARVHLELSRELHNLDRSASPVPHFAYMTFENWYNDILRSTANVRVRRASDLELLGDRFRDLLSVMNADYLRPCSDALRQGHARYRNEQAMKSARAAKDSYDRFVESYNAFCEEINEAAKRRVLTAVHNLPPVF
jgi:hypothetical protein